MAALKNWNLNGDYFPDMAGRAESSVEGDESASWSPRQLQHGQLRSRRGVARHGMAASCRHNMKKRERGKEPVVWAGRANWATQEETKGRVTWAAGEDFGPKTGEGSRNALTFSDFFFK
jgi:hypothetical protein